MSPSQVSDILAVALKFSRSGTDMSNVKHTWPVFLVVLISLFGLTAVVTIQDEPQGDPLVGGLLYAAWDVVLGVEPPQENHPLWDNEIVDENTWRCVSCHGWNYSGAGGITLQDSGEFIEYPGLFTMVAEPEENVIAWLDGSNNLNHDFSSFLTDTALQDLSAFLISSSYMVSPDLIANEETGIVRGTSMYGEELYKLKCKVCHGTDGSKINFGSAELPAFLGDMAVFDPWRMAHTIRFGHVNVKVPPGADFDWSFNNEIDLLAYTQHMPLARRILKEENQVLDYSEQADTRYMVYASIGVVVVILGGVLWTILRDRNIFS
jgi:mono/diheme cytochrome c family protein